MDGTATALARARMEYGIGSGAVGPLAIYCRKHVDLRLDAAGLGSS